MSESRYRKDIDGMRALAVLPVMAYHTGLSGIPGGFVGVDIFFVISGFLVVGIIHRAVEAGSFSFLDFYRRRSLRILPSFFLVTAVTLVAGYFLLLPPMFQKLGESALYSSFFSSNWFFWKTADYFSGPKEFMPLLHTWSLSVEEQFYVVVPIFMVLLGKYGRQYLLSLLVLSVVLSFFLCEVALSLPRLTSASGAFYLLPFRFWEMGVGAILAVGLAKKVFILRSVVVANSLSVVGFLLILLSYVYLDSADRFPGLLALFPTMGAVLLIFAGPRAIINRVLSLRLLVIIGALSYSLYLWHWPIILYLNILFDLPLYLNAVVVFVLSFIFSYASLKLIENPFRYGMSGVTTRSVLFCSLCCLILLGLVGFFIKSSTVNERFFKSDAVKVSKYLDYMDGASYREQFRRDKCFIIDIQLSSYDKSLCLTEDESKKNILLIGDSHTAHLWKGLSESFGDDYHLLEASAAGCRPLLYENVSSECEKLINFVLMDFLPKSSLDAIVVSARWREHEGLQRILELVEYVSQYVPKVYLLGPTVEYYGPLPEMLANNIQYGTDIENKDVVESRIVLGRSIAEAIQSASLPKVQYISVHDLVCPNTQCRVWASAGVPMQFDYGHFTLSGARVIAPRIVEAMNLPK